MVLRKTPTTEQAAEGLQTTAVNGVLLLDKGPGISSSRAVQKVRNLFLHAKAGHTGTLDPLASGLLPICLGEATKFSHPILESDKSYLATMRLGFSSTTGDSEGELSPANEPRFDDDLLSAALEAMRGEIDQRPPMYSAVKIDGKRLYTLARQGLSVERKPRRIHVYRLVVVDRVGMDLTISVSCSKGTYVRVLAEDLAERLGTAAYLTALQRVSIGDLRLSDAVTLDALERLPTADRLALLRPVDHLLTSLPRMTLDDVRSRRLCNGLSVSGLQAKQASEVRIYDPSGHFLGLGVIDENQTLKSKRLVSQAF